jgi:hypothetical protein
VKTYEITFERDASPKDPAIPLCQKAVVWVNEETARGAEDYARIRFDFTTIWKVKGVKEVV